MRKKKIHVGELGKEGDIVQFQVSYFVLTAIYKINSKNLEVQTNMTTKINADE